MGVHSYTGAQKASILFMTFGEEIATELFKTLSEFEVKRIGTAMSRLGRLEQDEVEGVIEEFWGILQQNKTFLYGGSDITKKVLGSAFKGGEDIAEQLGITSAHLDSLGQIEAKSLAAFLRSEHPQTIALILAHLDSKKMGETIKLLPEALHPEILLRIAHLDAVSPDLIEEIEEVLKLEVQATSSIALSRLGGVDHIAAMMNFIDKATEETLIGGIEERNPDLAEEIRNLMFVFEDLAKIDDRGIQEILKVVNNDKWKVGLRNASDPLKDLIFKNMSSRAAQMLKEDMESMGAVKISDVEGAQQEILVIVRKLEEEGKIMIASAGQASFV